MTIRCAIYAHFSTHMQRDASITDQIRLVSDYIHKQNGWTIAEVYSDYAISGSSDARPEFQRMLNDIRTGTASINIVVAEGLDRLTRNQATIAGLYQELDFLGIKL